MQSRKYGQYRPFYSPDTGGDGITVGTRTHKTITYTENFFRAQPAFKGHGYAHDIRTWLSISAHEVGHLPQIDRAGGLLPYLGGFVWQYTTNGSHDAAPLEAEAERGTTMFERFYRFTTQRNGANAVEKLLSAPTLSDTTKINRIKEWWRVFRQHSK